MKQAPAPQAGTFYGTIGGKIPYEPVRLLSLLALKSALLPNTVEGHLFQTLMYISSAF